MKIEIIEEKENPLLNRKELKFKVLQDAATPSRHEVKKKLIALLNAKKETVILDSFTSGYGLTESIGSARVYKSEDRAREVESKFLIDKNLREKAAAEEKGGTKKTEKEEKAEKKAPEREVAAQEKTAVKKPEKKPKEK